ncbi:hypothetical protein [Hydrogenophaga sp. 2FB]|nr:hypothetical protein [Hydrogenophaga sp. 2FB]
MITNDLVGAQAVDEFRLMATDNLVVFNRCGATVSSAHGWVAFCAAT